MAVGAGRDQADGVQAAAGGDGGEEAGDLGAAGDPGQLGRHGQDHVLAQQRGQGVDVAAPPRVGEPVEDLPLVIIEPRVSESGIRRARAGQGGPGALQGAVDRRDADLQQVCYLDGAPGQHVAEDEGGALPGGQPLQRGDECQRDALAPFGDGGRVGVRVRELVQEAVGVGLQVPDLAGGHRAAGFGADDLQAAGAGNPVQPVAQRRLALIGVQRPPGVEQRILQGLVCLVEGPQHPVGVHVQGAQVRADSRRAATFTSPMESIS